MDSNKSLDPAILMQKLYNIENEDSVILKAYKDTIQSTELDILIDDIKKMTDVQYDFKFLTREKEYFSINRHDTRELCDMVCKLLGNRIEEICIKPIISKPSRYEDYCPFSSEDLIVYSVKPLDNTLIMYEGRSYNILDTKHETTPYYSLYCSSINR